MKYPPHIHICRLTQKCRDLHIKSHLNQKIDFKIKYFFLPQQGKVIWSVGKGDLEVKAGRLGQEEWNPAAKELERTSATGGKKQREVGCSLLG